MKKLLILILAVIAFYTINPKFSFAVDSMSEENGEGLLKEQEDKYGIPGFLSETEEFIGDFDIKDLFKSSIKGDFDNSKILTIVFTLLGENLKDALLTISGIIVVVIISSILKSISENLGNESIAKIAYYIQYILI